jgi:putative membrane protein
MKISNERQAGSLALVMRGVIGGVLMGLANLVPGISGGTMLLAVGIYPLFIGAIAEVSTCKFRFRPLLLLGTVTVSAGLAILLLAGVVKMLVSDYRMLMYSLFIGLTLGGLPVVWKLAKPATTSLWAGLACGFLAMSGLAWLQVAGIVGGGENSGPVMLFVAGSAGASAMILPGVSGSYLLLVLGQYVPILSAISDLKEALGMRDFAQIVHLGWSIILPVGLGVVVGIVGFSNLLKYLLDRHAKVTMGVLMGLLLGAVVGLWPFQVGVPPQIGDIVKGREVTEERLQEMDATDYPTHYFKPTAAEMGMAAGMVLVGLIGTSLIARMEPIKESTGSSELPEV